MPNFISAVMGRNARDNHPTPFELDLEQLLTHVEREDKDGPYFGPYKLGGDGTRNAANVVAYSAIVLDVDKRAEAIEIVKSLMDAYGHSAALYTTFSHTEQEPRYRLVVPLAAPLDARFMPAAVHHVAGVYGLEFDPASLSQSQMFYLPSCRPGAPRDSWSVAGEPLVLPVFPEPVAPSCQSGEWRDCSVDGSESDTIPLDDLRRVLLGMQSMKAAFGEGVTARQIWEVDEDALAAKWPSENATKVFDRSSALASLWQSAGWVCGHNHERAKELLEEAPFRDLYTDDEWDRHTLLCAERWPQSGSFYQPRHTPNVSTLPQEVVNRDGFALFDPSAQMDMWSECCYVESHHAVLMANGRLLAPDRFNASQPGGEYTISKGKETRKPFDAFVGSQYVTFPKAERLAFRPEMPPREVFEEAGRTFVNSYVPCPGARTRGDVSPFLQHLSLLLPDERDREILLSWMAGIVQSPGVKARWSPVLIGTQGNGKSLVADVLAAAVGRGHVVKPRADQLGGRFNSWIEGRLLAIVEEVHTQGRREVMDALKPLITEERIETEGKGRDAVMTDNRCNLIMCSNHPDAIHKTEDDRRYAVFFCAQQSAEEKARDGMNDGYFSRLFDWLEDGGYSIVADYLDNFSVSVSLKGCAPVTSTTARAIEESRSPAQQLLIESVELNKPGFAGGLILGDALTGAMTEAGIRIHTRAQSKLLEECGYIKHPMLPDGRIKLQGRDVRVYVKKGHPAGQMADVRGYMERLATQDMAERLVG
ncbi:DUF5906 domain-containing protein [Aeromonas hydrophila]|uniref:primase-helicase family protein n=1 Tax=Aeromonas hydrophila TaxID=644 RepID=UPI0029D65C92|nr:DUF5906 domain-containing protein [Aeromonas hydrophila]MDX7777914.1 DUF5906 domain-containing protein [Aeromonas hydrophila]